ncbi:MAG: hypothetical protein L0922_07490 [Candidatus Mariimomonas ferrooxydans]
MPLWAYEGGHDEELKIIRNEQERLTHDILSVYMEKTYWENVKISSVNLNKNRWMEGKSLADIGIFLKKTPLKCLFEILLEEDLRVDAIFYFNERR